MTDDRQSAHSQEKQQIPGKLGKYRVIEELGRGGMAVVYKCEDTETGKIVAAKALLPDLTAQVSFVKRFRREIETHRDLDHPNIVRILDVGEEGTLQFYVMEYVDGPTVERRLRLMGKFPVNEALGVTRAVAGALQYSHGRGVVHRDIKPANIIMDSKGAVKLTDFGIARDAEATRLTVTGGIVGTADYMSPEQAEGRRATRKSDIYSVGVCLYHMLTGRTPFTGKTYLDIIRAQRFSLPESPRTLNPSIPGRVARLVESMMEKDPDKRPPSAADVIARLDQIESSQGQLSDEEREAAGELVRTALFPAAGWKEITIKVAAGVVAAVLAFQIATAVRYRYFTTADHKYELGMTQFHKGDYQGARQYFDEVEHFHPGTPDASLAVQRIEEIDYINRKKDAPAVKVARTKPDGMYHYNSAVELIDKGRVQDGVHSLENLVRDLPDTKGAKLAAVKLDQLKAGTRRAPVIESTR